MSGSPAPAAPETKTVYLPPPPPPGPPVQVPTQALTTQTALDQTSAAQQRLNATLGATLDRTNYEFNTTQDIRKGQAAASEQRFQTQTQGEQQRTTNTQAEMYRRYQNNLDYTRSQNAYKA